MRVYFYTHNTYMHVHTNMCAHTKRTRQPNLRANPARAPSSGYGVATVSSIDKIIRLFCRISSLLWVSFAKETYNFIDPTSQSHPIVRCLEYENITKLTRQPNMYTFEIY